MHNTDRQRETEQERQDRENREHCKRIAETLEAYANGDVWRDEDGEEVNASELTDEERERLEETGEQLGLWDYFDDYLDVKYILDSNRELYAVRVMVAYGGPNIYIDTEDCAVKLYWWTDRAEYPIDPDVCEAVDDIFREWFNC